MPSARRRGPWFTDDLLNRSAKDIGNCIGEIVGQVLFEVLLQILLAVATEGGGNAAEIAAAAGQGTRAGRASPRSSKS